uniref:PASTA domain-containing protein n=1 Tax=Gemmiger formicilis TaxID=745368 RepID=UPI004025923D
DNPERNINRVVSNTKPSPKSTSIHTGDARRVGTSNPGRSKSAQKKKKKKASKGFSLLPIFFGMAVAFVIGAAILIYLIFTNSSNLLFSNRADVQVISFVGMTKDEFLATDYNNLLRAEFPEEYSSEPAGTIIRQTPKAGRTVKEKQRIVLTVSLGTQYVTIPETKNMVAEDAEQTLKDMGLRVTKKPMSDNSVANGAVVYTQPAAGETVEGDSTVILYVSRSEVSKESQVPSLTGKTIEEARNEVKGLNLSIRTIEQASEQPAGTVLSQSPDAGSTVRKSSVITLVVSTGVPEVVATPEPVEPTVNEDGTITVQESWWPSADGSHQIHQLTDGTMWNENGQRCDAQGNPIA